MIRRLLAALGLVWALGFVLFALALPAPADDRQTDGIVVLTGGPGRLARGLRVLAAGRAQRLLVSGVDRRVRPAELAAASHLPPALFARVDLGHEAVDTRSNADETAAWIARHRYRSLRLVTTDWHMRRARLELARTLPPAIAIVADAVRSEPDLLAFLKEYNKYLLRWGGRLAGI